MEPLGGSWLEGIWDGVKWMILAPAVGLAVLATPAAILGIFFPDFVAAHPVISGAIALSPVGASVVATWNR